MPSVASSLHSRTMIAQGDVSDGLQDFFILFELRIANNGTFLRTHQKVTHVAQAVHLTLVTQLRRTVSNVNIVQ